MREKIARKIEKRKKKSIPGTVVVNKYIAHTHTHNMRSAVAALSFVALFLSSSRSDRAVVYDGALHDDTDEPITIGQSSSRCSANIFIL